MIAVASVKTRPQVFLSFSRADGLFAERVSRGLAASGITIVRPDQLTPGGEYTSVVRDALHRSQAVVVLLGRGSPDEGMAASVLFEIGAAAGANKPIYVVVEDPRSTLPHYLSNARVLPMNRLGEIADDLA